MEEGRKHNTFIDVVGKKLKKRLDNIQGDKVVWLIVLGLIFFSLLTISSSTSLLSKNEVSRMDIILDHVKMVFTGLVIIVVLYNIKSIRFFRLFSQLGFGVSLLLLGLLLSRLDLGFIKAQEINDTYRTLGVMGFQIHVYEAVKILMVLYLGWAIHAFKKEMEEKENMFKIANLLGRFRYLEWLKKPIVKRLLYIYIPIFTVTVMVSDGSNTSALIILIILMMIVWISGLPMKEIFIMAAIVIMFGAMAVGIHKASDGKMFERVGTALSRLKAEYTTDELENVKPGSKEFFHIIDDIRQPLGAKIAVHEGGLLGKGSGNSTQKYLVTNIYGDYMFSFIIEEYGLIGAIAIMILYVSLLARGSMIARYCKNAYAQVVVGGFSLLITLQAFIHMFVCVDIGPMTGQTLPLVSHGSFAFLMFCIAFGIILSISRMAQEKIREEEERLSPSYEDETDDMKVNMSVLEDIDNQIE